METPQMDSLFHKINQSASPDDWHRFRIGREQMLHLAAAARSMKLEVREHPGNASGTVIEISDAPPALCVIESPAQSPPLFRLFPDTCAVGFAESGAAVADYYAWRSATPPPPAATAADNNGGSRLSLLAGRAEYSAWLQLECAILRALQGLSHLDSEGELLFTAVGNAVRDLLITDQVELELERPFDFWPGKTEGWVWVDAESARPAVSCLTPRLRRLLYRRERVMFVDELAGAADIQWPPDVPDFAQGFLFPLVSAGKPLGILRYYVRQPVVSLPGDMEGLELLRRELSRLFDHISAHLQMQRLAMIDGLTSLFNHRFFRDQLRTEYQRALRYQKKMTLIMLDIDDFKLYNDTFGHLAGDRMLAETARTIRNAVRDIDFVARYGGEEFVLILPEVDARSGMIVAEKIRRAVEAQRIESADGDGTSAGTITVSCGVTDNVNTIQPEDLIERADKALYWVKRHGRNLVQLAAEAYE